ncbi:hypothetical protein [Sorangium sp. So ce1078]|uniref:hypothetical protein n=1 Tax=Sorangium sp. So ce1078 TaxID=3133329 RepID=UPI003F61FD6C
MARPDTSTPEKLSDKPRKFTMTLVNETQWTIQFQSSYFNSGRFEDAPTNVKPFNSMQFSGCDKDNSIMTGVSGGTAFRILIPTANNDYAHHDFSVGFSAPYGGAYKTSVVREANAERAYDAIKEGTTSLSSGVLNGLDEDGKEVGVKFELVAESGEHTTCTITQQLVQR